MDVTGAAQEIFEWAVYATTAVWAAINLTKRESGNTNVNKKSDNSREIISEGEDKLHASLLMIKMKGNISEWIGKLL